MGYAELANLPSGAAVVEQQRRDELWRQMDGSVNGYATITEVHGQLAPIASLPQGIESIVQLAKEVTGGRLGPQFVEAGREFRRLLLCVRRYAELAALLLGDTEKSVDRPLDTLEYEVATPLLGRWSVVVDPSSTCLRNVLPRGASLEDLARWALHQLLSSEPAEVLGGEHEGPLPAQFGAPASAPAMELRPPVPPPALDALPFPLPSEVIEDDALSYPSVDAYVRQQARGRSRCDAAASVDEALDGLLLPASLDPAAADGKPAPTPARRSGNDGGPATARAGGTRGGTQAGTPTPARLRPHSAAPPGAPPHHAPPHHAPAAHYAPHHSPAAHSASAARASSPYQCAPRAGWVGAHQPFPQRAAPVHTRLGAVGAVSGAPMNWGRGHEYFDRLDGGQRGDGRAVPASACRPPAHVLGGPLASARALSPLRAAHGATAPDSGRDCAVRRGGSSGNSGSQREREEQRVPVHTMMAIRR
eukprot:4063655-Prymnesium_polylepis.1